MNEYAQLKSKIRGKSLPHDTATIQERFIKGNQLDELDKSPNFFFETKKTATNNIRSLSQQKPLPESLNLKPDFLKKEEGDTSFCVDDITEEGLDDWIAQSSNRNITSYLDPHRQFKAPISLVTQLRKRYKVKTKLDYSEQKKLYFSNNEERTNIKCSDLFQVPQTRVRNPIELTFDHNNLSPKSLAGTSIRLREAKLFSQQEQINNITSNSSSPYKTKRQPKYNLEHLSPEKLQIPDYKRDSETERNGPKLLKEILPLQETLKDTSRQRNYNVSGKNTMSLQEVIDSMKQRSKSIQYQISPSPKKRRQDSCNQSPEASYSNIHTFQLNKQSNTVQIKLPMIRINDIHQNNNDSSIQNNQSHPITPNNLPSQLNFFSTSIDESETPINNCKQKLTPQCRSPRNSKILQSNPNVDKGLMKKIIEKVEKLLEEKEESFRGKDQEKADSGTTCSFEENYGQNMDELDIEIARGGLKSQQDSVTASYLKGVGRMKKNKDKNAVAAFKQALTFDKAHFPSIYGLACIYERNKMLKIAEQWLEIGALFGQNMPQINYGFALIFYKQHRYEESLKKIEFIISEVIETSNNCTEDGEQIRQSYLYLRSLCAKKLGQKLSDANRQSAKDGDGTSKGSSNRTPSKRMQKQLLRRDIASKSPEKSNKQSVTESKNEISEFQIECNQVMSTPTSDEYYTKASSDYKAFVKYTCPKNFNLLKNLMFAIVFKKIRKMEIKFPPHILCEFISLVNQILAADSYTPVLEPIVSGQFITSIQRPIRQRSLTRRKLETSLESKSIILSGFESKRQDIVDTISKLSFFNRFEKSTIEKVLPQLQLRYLPKTENLFAKKGEVFIIIAGHLTVFDHQKQFDSPEIVAYYSEGDIIGCEDKDNKISFHPDIWFLSLSRIEYLVMSESEFTNLWNIQNSLALKTNLNFIQSIDLFERTSQLLQYRLAFELLVEKTFKEGDIVFNDGESVNKYNYIELIKEDPRSIKNLRNRISNKITYLPLMHQNIQGFYLVQGGSLKLLTLGNWQEYSLNPYNYVGENLLFPTLSISRFGQIVCQTNNSKCLFLSQYHFHKINSLDKEIMRLKVLGSEYYANCQKILFKFYKYHKVNNFDLPIQSISN